MSNYQFSDQELALITKTNATHDCEFERWDRKLKQSEDQADLIAKWKANHLAMNNLVLILMKKAALND